MTTPINLLPWREMERKRRTLIFITFSVLVVVVVLSIAGSIQIILSYQIEFKEKWVLGLKEEINNLEGIIQEIAHLQNKKKQYQNFMNITQSFQKDKFFALELFNTFSSAVPKGIYLTKIVRKENRITVEGKAKAHTAISLFMDQLFKISMFSEVLLKEMERQKESKRKRNNNDPNDIDFSIQILMKTTK